MPSPQDLTGQQFSQLLVIERLEYIRFGDDRRGSIWLVECQSCGRHEKIRQYRIPYTSKIRKSSRALHCCTICTRGPCEICGNEIISDLHVGVCSPQCAHERTKKQQLEHYYRQVENDPNYHKKKYQQLISDDEKRQRMRQRDHENAIKRQERMRNDPEYRERVRAQQRENYWKNRDSRIKRRKELFDALPIKEQIKRTIMLRERGRQHYWEKREDILAKRQRRIDSMTDEQREQYMRRKRASVRRSKNKAAISAIRNLSDYLHENAKKKNE